MQSLEAKVGAPTGWPIIAKNRADQAGSDPLGQDAHIGVFQIPAKKIEIGVAILTR